MNSFDKTFLILETVVLQNGAPTTPSTVSRITGIHLVTCSRTMGMLAKKGYLQRVSAHAGYVAGAMCISLGIRNGVYARLAAAARDPLRKLADVVKAQVNLSVDQNQQRIMLVCEGLQGNGWPQFRFDYENGAATNRLLMAVMDPDYPERDQILAEKHVEFVEKTTDLMIMGELILVEGYPPAAFGYGFQQTLGVERVREASRAARQAIEYTLTPNCF